jgi:hypothetical protein
MVLWVLVAKWMKEEGKMDVLKSKVYEFVCERYRTMDDVIREFGLGALPVLEELLGEGAIEHCFVYLKGRRLIFTKKGEEWKLEK